MLYYLCKTMIITAIMCTYGRHLLLERAVKCFLDQNLDTHHNLLIYNNSSKSLSLDNFPIPENKSILLINNYLDLETDDNYKNVGDIFRDALKFVPSNTHVVNFMDDDDIFLPNHLLEGQKGMRKAVREGKRAYKPYYSYFKYGTKLSLEHNNMEPSIFVDLSYVKEKGFRRGVGDYHQGWLDPMKEEKLILEDKNGVPTFIYDWSGDNGSWKISGGDNSSSHFEKHHRVSNDFGDGIITPVTDAKIKENYNLVNYFQYAQK